MPKMSNFELKHYSPWCNEVNEATKFHPNNQGLPTPGSPAAVDADQVVFHQSKSISCVDAQCGKIIMGDEVFGKEIKDGAGCGNKDSGLTSTSTKETPSSQNAPFSLYSSQSNTISTDLLITSSKAVFKDKFPQQHPTLRNADLDRSVDNSAEIGKEAAGKVEVTDQMVGAGRQAKVVVGRGRGKKSCIEEDVCSTI